MGTHPIFESDFDCLTDCQAVRLAFEMAKKDMETLQTENPLSPPISLRTRNKKVKDCHVEERIKLDMEETEFEKGDAPKVSDEPVTTDVETEPKIEQNIEESD